MFGMDGLKKNQYLNPGMVEKYGTAPSPDKIVIVYDNSVYKICPNPDDISRSESIKEQDAFDCCQRFCLTKEQFDNPDFWNR